MAQVVVDSRVMRDKAKTIENAAKRILDLYNEMLREVNTTAGKMKGSTIDTQERQFASMQSVFETFSKDIESYASFLTQAAEQYEAAENEGLQKAQEQGKVF